MSDLDNRQRAELFLHSYRCVRDSGEAPVMILRLEHLLSHAEDRGGERAALLGEPDAMTVDELRRVVFELMPPSVSGLDGERHKAANDITQVIVGLFYIRRRDEPEEATDPIRP